MISSVAYTGNIHTILVRHRRMQGMVVPEICVEEKSVLRREGRAPEAARGVVYSHEMNDSDVKKLLNEIGHTIIEVIKNRQELAAPAVPVPDRRPHGLGQWLRTIVSVFIIVGGLWAGLNYVVSSAINSALMKPALDLNTLTEQGKGLRRDVDRLLDRMAKATLQSPPGLPTKDAARQIKDAAEWAVRRKIEIDPDTLQRVSAPLLKTPSENNWEATIALVNLRSFVNTTLEYAKQHVAATVVPVTAHTHFPQQKPGEWIEFVHARFKLDGRPGEEGLLSYDNGRPVVFVTNLIVRDSIVEYRGGQITLVNVFFENCEFQITNNDNGRRMAQALLNPTPYTSFVGS